MERLSGILLHPTSLAGGVGVGDMGPAAYRFVDFLADAGFGLWQMLPLGPVGHGGSPYQSSSSFAGNPLLISVDGLVKDGLLAADDPLVAAKPPEAPTADFAQAREHREAALAKAFARFQTGGGGAELAAAFTAFVKEKRAWLDDFALFTTLKAEFGGALWSEWPEAKLVARDAAALRTAAKKRADALHYHRFTQFVFFRQWTALRAYARAKNVRLVGDLPIYAALDSADVWTNPGGFELDKNGRPLRVAGVPPDYFCPTGQLWGNPLYRWDEMAKDGFAWWTERLKATLALVDWLRLDHFRGLESYWAVPAADDTAMNGTWEPGPGMKFLEALARALGTGKPAELPIMAEDLGVITPEVEALRDGAGLPGMKVLQFAFNPGAENLLPHRHVENCVCYTGTHDNDTARGWYDATGPDYAHMDPAALAAERDRARRYLGRDGSSIHWDLMRLALSSVARLAVTPMQDVLALGNDARMNRPGTGEGQWRWRLTSEQMGQAPVAALRDMNDLYERTPRPAPAPAPAGGKARSKRT